MIKEQTSSTVTPKAAVPPTLEQLQAEIDRLNAIKSTHDKDTSEGASTPAAENKKTADLMPLVPPAKAGQIDQANNAATTPGVNLSSEDFELLQQLKQERRVWALRDRKEALGPLYKSRSNTLFLRRAQILYPNLVPMEDVIAYGDIFDLREAVTAKGKKVLVSDKEIEVYHQLEAAGTKISLEAIMSVTKAEPEEDTFDEE